MACDTCAQATVAPVDPPEGALVGFRTIDGDEVPQPVLRQVGPKAFQLVEPFRYVHPSGPPDGYVVPAHDPDRGPEDGNASDLASVPPFLWWLIASYGQHTLAALLHDHLVGRPDTVDRVGADRLFRDGMGDLGVALVRRWVMWAVVASRRCSPDPCLRGCCWSRTSSRSWA